MRRQHRHGHAPGPARRASGFVIGQHAYVLVDLPEAQLRQVTHGRPGHGRGRSARAWPWPTTRRSWSRTARRGCWRALAGGTGADGRLEVHVAARVPAAAVGAGAGMASEYANTDLMGAYAGQGDDLSLGLEALRIGDVVALADQDHRFGRGYREG